MILPPTVNPFTLRTLILVAPVSAFAESVVWFAWVPTFVTVTVSIPWPTLSMSNLILPPTEMLARKTQQVEASRCKLGPSRDLHR